MLEVQRRREEVGVRADPIESAGAGGSEGRDYFRVVDDFINNLLSSNSEAFNQQIEQENGQ